MCFNIFLLCFIIDLLSSNIFASLVVLDRNNSQIKELCIETQKCISKCCERGKHFNSTSLECINSEREYDFNNMPVYEYTEKSNDFKPIKTLGDVAVYLVPGEMYEKVGKNKTLFSDLLLMVAEDYELQSYLTETGEVYIKLETGNVSRVNHSCVEYVITEEDNVAKPRIVIATLKLNVDDPETTYYNYCLIISCVFLAIVFIVYILLPELQNLGGMILMAYVTSLFMAFLLLAIMNTPDKQFKQDKCIYISASVYFFITSTFCWMNVMSVDIWWTFRGYAKARPIHRRGERFKFFMYCVYAWGLSAAMTIGLVVVNSYNVYLSQWIVTPQIPLEGCFLNGKPQFYYMYIPMLILILSNWLFFLMTSYNIRRLMRDTAILSSNNNSSSGNPAAHRRQKNRFTVYVKLSLIMGINWLLEVFSYLWPHKLWQISDIYNMFIGLGIFLIFVCKKKIYLKLKQRFYDLRERLPCIRRSEQTYWTQRASQTTSQETTSHTLSSGPQIEPKNTDLK